MTSVRQPTADEAREIMEQDARVMGYTVGANPCQSIPPRHSPYRASDGITYCTRCGEEVRTYLSHESEAA